jgi:hypothetical protein
MLKHVTLKASSLVLLALVTALGPSLLRGDDLTGLSQNDAKDLMPAQSPAAPCQRTGATLFAPLPSWARSVIMPPLPYQLTPMGRKPVVATASPAPTPLAPPPETAPAATADATAKPKPAPTETTSPTLMAVSPFLQWVKSNPQAAAAQARQQASSYKAAPGSATEANGTDDTYWLPPLIDSGDFSAKPVTGSAAIYTTPQR